MTKSFCRPFSCPGLMVAAVRGRMGSEQLRGQLCPGLEWAGQHPREEGRAKYFLGGDLALLCVPSKAKGSKVTFGQLATSLSSPSSLRPR